MKILWIPHDSWKTPQRCKPFCRELSKRHEVHVISFEKFSCLRDFVSLRYLKNYVYRVEKDDNVVVHWIPRISPAIYSRLLRRINYGISSYFIQKIIDKYDIDSVVSTFVVKPPKCRKLIFDVFDDNVAGWKENGINKSYSKEINDVEQEYLVKSNKIVVISTVLRDKILSINPNYEDKLVLIPNSIDVEKFAGADGENIREKYNLNGNVVGFIGNHGDFTGLLRLIEASKVLTNITFLIVGSGSLVPRAKSIVADYGLKNVIFTDQIESADIAKYYKAIDIGVIPFDKRVFTDSSLPIKLLEYTIAGKPVVSTELEEIKRLNFPNVILSKADVSSLINAIKKSLDFKFSMPIQIEKYDVKYLTQKFEEVLK